MARYHWQTLSVGFEISDFTYWLMFVDTKRWVP